ncbi:hypothetical protein KDM16_001777 [Campylobacter jejuni]|nr:hypothetical protein [Campylobacter jejuni]EHR4131494.1 hypothetical protein [Campylobacter jejuni]EIG9789956.1 hypothetical protein [Campylobacter jejuni]
MQKTKITRIQMSKKTKRQIEDEKDYDGRSLFDLIELEFSQGEENELLISKYKFLLMFLC